MTEAAGELNESISALDKAIEEAKIFSNENNLTFNINEITEDDIKLVENKTTELNDIISSYLGQNSSKIIDNVADKIDEAIKLAKESNKDIEVVIRIAIEKNHKRKNIIGKSTKPGISKIKEFLKNNANFFGTNIINKPEEQKVETVSEPLLINEPVLNDVIEVIPEEVVNVDEAIINIQEATEVDYKDVLDTPSEVKTPETIIYAPEHPINVLDGIKDESVNTNVSTDALIKTGYIKPIENEKVKNMVINTSKHSVKNFICTIAKTAKDKFDGFWKKENKNSNTETLSPFEKAIANYKEKVRLNKEKLEMQMVKEEQKPVEVIKQEQTFVSPELQDYLAIMNLDEKPTNSQIDFSGKLI